MVRPFPTRSQLGQSFVWGLLFCLCQVIMAVLVSRGGYFSLNQWDSFHYMDIASHGYHIPQGALTPEGVLTPEDVHSNRANVGYFPAFPLLIRAVSSIFSASIETSALLVSQFFCVLFWMQLFLWLSYRSVSPYFARALAGVILIYPASFFLVAGYSESLFLAALMGFVLWTDCWLVRSGSDLETKTLGSKNQLRSGGSQAGLLAALNGLFLSSTRLVGIPLIIYPFLRWAWGEGPSLSVDRKSQPLWKVVFLTGLASLGGLAFFVFCQVQFNHWNLYFKLQQLGWGNFPNFLAVFFPSSYFPKLFFEDTTTSVCRFSNFFILTLLIWTGLKLKKSELSLYYLAISMFFISLSGKANYNMDSMVRYNLPVFVLLVLLVMTQKGEAGLLKLFENKSRKVLFWIGCLVALAFQIWMIRVFTKGGWVA